MKNSNPTKIRKTGGFRLTKSTVKYLLILLVAVLAVVFSVMLLDRMGEEATNEVAVAYIDGSDVIPANTYVTADMFKQKFVDELRLDPAIILYEDIGEYVGLYTKFQLRPDSPAYNDIFMTEKPLANKWLYDMEKNEDTKGSVVITIPFDYLELAGKILRPADRVYVLNSYENDEYDSRDPYYYDEETGEKTGSMPQYFTDVLFEEATITDMLNNDGTSVSEIYRAVLNLDEEERETVLSSREFKASIQPKSMILVIPKDTFKAFAEASARGELNLTFGLLGRESENFLLDQMNTVESEINIWAQEE